MATKATKKPSLTEMNKTFMGQSGWDNLQSQPPGAGALAPNKGSLSGGRSGTVARVRRNSMQPRGSQSFNQAEDINALFQGLRQQGTPQGTRKPIVRRGFSGQELNADGSDPGSGLAWMDRNNSEAKVNERHARVARDDARRYAQRDAAGAAAVQERKNLQAMGGAPFQQQNPNLVKGNDGYMDLFGPGGKILGSTRPQNRVQGFGDPTNTALESQRASQGMQDSFQQNFRAGNSPGAMPPPTRNDFLTPGGGGGATVGGSPAQGAPGGGDFPVTQQPDAWQAMLGGLPQSNPFESQQGFARLNQNFIPAQNAMNPDLGSLDAYADISGVGPRSFSNSNSIMGKAQGLPLSPETETAWPLRIGQLSEPPFVGPQLPNNFLPIPQQPYGNTNGIANLRGLVPRLGQGVEDIGASVTDFWNYLLGQPQTAYDQFKIAQDKYARDQYRRGVR